MEFTHVLQLLQSYFKDFSVRLQTLILSNSILISHSLIPSRFSSMPIESNTSANLSLEKSKTIQGIVLITRYLRGKEKQRKKKLKK